MAMKKILFAVTMMLIPGWLLAQYPGDIDSISNSEAGSSVRVKLNADISRGNDVSDTLLLFRSLIDTNITGIATNLSSISDNDVDISALNDSVAAHLLRIAAEEDSTAALRSSIEANSGDISTNEGNISTNTSNISTNSGNITTLQQQWTKGTGYLTPYNSGYDILLGSGTGRITWGDDDTYIYELSDDELTFYAGATQKMVIAPGYISLNDHLVPSGLSKTWNVGASYAFYDSLFIDEIFINSTSYGMYTSGSQLYFFDPTNGPQPLGDLIGGGSADSSWNKITLNQQASITPSLGDIYFDTDGWLYLYDGASYDTLNLPSGGGGGGSGTVTSVQPGNGLDFTTITNSGAVTMGTPSTLTASTTNAVTTTSHTHEITGYLVPADTNSIDARLDVIEGAGYLTGSDTTGLSQRITNDSTNLATNYLALSDTASMLANYLEVGEGGGSAGDSLTTLFTWRDSVNTALADTTSIGDVAHLITDLESFTFGFGLNSPADTAGCFDGAILGVFPNPEDTIKGFAIDDAVALGTSASVTVRIYYDVNIYDATPTTVWSGTLTNTPTYSTTFTNADIPPGTHVWGVVYGTPTVKAQHIYLPFEFYTGRE